jgi:hypothetical protein
LKRSRNTLGPLVGFHGCDRKVGQAVLAGKKMLQPSRNDYDWLGHGIYFWVDSADRGLEWARQQRKKQEIGTQIDKPFVVGAFIYPGLCLNLTDHGVGPQLVHAYSTLLKTLKQFNTPMPKNTVREGGTYLKRTLDCAVINTLHSLRKKSGEDRGIRVKVFISGQSLHIRPSFLLAWCGDAG